MLAQIFGFVILSFILVVMYGIKFKHKSEVLPMLGALVFMLLSKILRQLFNFKYHRSNTAFYFLFILVSITP